MNYFRHEKITEDVYRIIDILDNCFYLVIGEEKACLLDTGDGFGPLRDYVETLTEKYVFVILTHAHLDHVGGCVFYDEVYLNPKDNPLFKDHNDSNYRLKYYQENDVVKDVPIKNFNRNFSNTLKPIANEEIFDLGNLHIKMIEVAGHSMGIMIPIIQEKRIAIFGDACGVGTLLFAQGSTSINGYRDNLLNFKKYEDEYDIILRNHGTFESPKELLDNVIEATAIILQGNYVKEPIQSHGFEFLVAYEIDEYGNRVDGKQGNIKFTLANL